MNQIEIYTDGACKGNPGPGGWGVLLKSGTTQKELYGGDPSTTNNRMELMAVIQAGRVDLGPMVTHRFKLDDIERAYDLFGHQRDGVLKVAITP